MLKYWKDLGDLPRPVWVVFASTLVNRAGSMVLSFLVLYLTRERGFSPEHAGFILFLYGVGAIVAGPLAGRLADRWGSVPLMRASLFCSGGMLLLYSLARTMTVIVVATIALAMLTEAFRPAAMSFFGEAVRPPAASRPSPSTAWPSTSAWPSGRPWAESSRRSRSVPLPGRRRDLAGRRRRPGGRRPASPPGRSAPADREPLDGDPRAPLDGRARRPALSLLSR